MMNENSFHLLGMHISWWFIVVILLFLAFAFFFVFSGQRTKKDSPLDILKRRLALGEISKDEFQEKKKILEG